ncbi:hypothetical protein BJY01DRAFT_253516 [Aspergillus pseudoustus]|uniref:Uncharacterized protein n=1 Tax=Aspergillus pseudoustus TaxID=1810923 RepID=A0ABR4J092_9EURO
MPLVLTAIDLKLSPSAAEMERRRRRLDSLGEIVRHSGRVYDVTDFVTAGTNHILRLAYMTSQHLFLRFDQDSPTPAITGPRTGNSPPNTSASESATTGSGPGMEVMDPSSSAFSTSRANTWHEAFLRYPRAYLLISTSVDYSLAVGRLPYDSALPELVRCIPPIGFGIRLPWTINSPQPEVPARRLIRNDSHSLPYLATNSNAAAATPGSAAGTEHTAHDVHTLPDDISVSTFPDASTDFSIPPVTTAGNSTLSNMPTTSTGRIPSHQESHNHNHHNNGDEINLDYLYIEPDAGMANNNNSNNAGGLLDHAGAEFDRMHFQQLAQGFDPLISSWVQEYFGEAGTGSSPHAHGHGGGNSPAMEMDGLSLGS